MTNGEKLKEVFPYMNIIHESNNLVSTDLDDTCVIFTKEWWNAEYECEWFSNKKLEKIREEIAEHRRKTETIDKYDLLGDALDIIDKHIGGKDK